ncbi:MAG: ABC transporter permease subunit [Dethiobacter sp.]|nr:ABC transporter permease subunit [Dethiobacter sp.]MCL5981049.1 ABC transporter permease [Bacillota bacterium]
MAEILKCTLKEMLNKKILLLILVLTAIFLALYGFGLREIYSQQEGVEPLMAMAATTQLVSIGLYFASFIIALLVIVAAAGTLAGDIESGVMQAMLVKPLKRWEVVAGKFLGIGLMVAGYSAFLFFAIIGLNLALGARIPFGSANLITGFLLFLLGPYLLMAATMWGSSRFSTLNASIMAVMLYGLAMVGGLLEQVGAMLEQAGQEGGALVHAGIISSLLLPTDILFRKATSTLFALPGMELFTGLFAVGPFQGISQPSPWMLAYAGGYAVFFLSLTIKNFGARDI